MTTEEEHTTSSPSRRFLELPAVRPCSDAVSALSLQRAILAIAQEITTRSSSSKEEDPSPRFPVQSCLKGARRAVHVTRLLLVFLEELHAGGEEEAEDLLLPGLCELYVAFQKLQVLLQDCALRGARILLLMSAHRVDREFRAFHESVATAVDSLLLSTTNLAAEDDEVAEMAELAGKQARRAARDAAAADLADDRTAYDVRAILARFERGVPPRRVTLRRVLDHLCVRTWTDCHAEVTFLDGQISLAGSDRTGSSSSSTSHLDLLHGIRGLMLYARAVLFDAAESTSSPAGTDVNSTGSGSPSSSSSELGWLDPEDLRCPISLDLMTDPVTVSTGQTYNRASIVRWLRAGNRTCPVTGKDLRGASSTDHLVPNLAVRNVVHRFCHARHLKIAELPESKSARSAVPAASRSNSTNYKAAAGAMRLVAAHLVRQLAEGSSEARSGAVREARLLAKSGTAARAALTNAGAAPWLLHLLASWDRPIQDDAAAAVMNLSKHPEGRREVFEAGGLVYLVDLLADEGPGTSSTSDSRANAAGALFYLATADEEYRLAIGETPRAVQGLVDLLKSGTYRGKKHAVTAILALLASPANHGPAIEAGAIPTMISLLATERDDIVADAMSAVAALADSPRGARALLADPSQVRSLVEVLRSPAPAAAKECCISVLAALCKNGGAETVGYLNRIPTLMTSLYSLLTESTPAASKKSSSLIRILHSNHATSTEDRLRFPASAASRSPASPPQLPPHGSHVHVR